MRSNHGGWRTRLALMCLGLAVLTACEPNTVAPGRENVPPSSITDLSFSESRLDLTDGDTARVPLQFTDVRGRTDVLRADDIEWSSTDSNVVVVDESGRLTANELGSAEIVARYGGLSAILRILV